MSDRQTLKMPIKRFWLFNESIDRLQAGKDIRAMGLHASLNNKDSAIELIDSLNEQVGTVVLKDYERDADSINSFRQQLLNDKLLVN